MLEIYPEFCYNIGKRRGHFADRGKMIPDSRFYVGSLVRISRRFAYKSSNPEAHYLLLKRHTAPFSSAFWSALSPDGQIAIIPDDNAMWIVVAQASERRVS